MNNPTVCSINYTSYPVIVFFMTLTGLELPLSVIAIKLLGNYHFLYDSNAFKNEKGSLYILYVIFYMLHFICYILYVLFYMLYFICYTLYVIFYMVYFICYILYVIFYMLYLICSNELKTSKMMEQVK